MKIRTRDGDWYVATSAKDWSDACERANRAAREREQRMQAWEQANPTNGYPPASYWEAYRAEKYRIAIEWPIPAGHVMFKGVA